MIVGNLIMLGYVGALGVLGMRRGTNFALLASIVFGRKGCVIASGLLSTLLLGWYAAQTGITGALVSSTYRLSYVLMTIIAGDAASHTTWHAIMAYAGNNGAATMSMGTGLTVAIALFIDAGTVTADFNRWARTTRGSDIDSDFRVRPFLAWAIGSAVGLTVEWNAPFMSTAICSMLTGAVAYYVVGLVAGVRTRTA